MELKATSKAVPEREGGKPQVWRKGLSLLPGGEGVTQVTDEGNVEIKVKNRFQLT